MKSLNNLEEIIEDYYDYKEQRISLIATENIASKLQKSCYLLGLSDQYCSRLPQNAMKIGNLSFGNIGVIDRINDITRIMVQDIFQVPECEVRLLSGVNGLTILLFSLLNAGDVLLKMSDSCGGHLSVKPIAVKLGVQVEELYYDDTMHLDMNIFQEKYERYKPKVILLDSSYILYQYPVRKIKEIVKNNAIIVYDASHVISLIACGQFQNPLLEGADIIHSTTHKILWGPQKAILLFKEKNEITKKMMDLIGDVLVSNTHLHHILALQVALIELKKYGKEYTEELIQNNKYFAECLSKRGFDIVAKECGYTESNQFWVCFENKKRAIEAFQILERLNISTNIILLPGEEWGLRLGTNEITRLGANKEFFQQLSDLFYQSVIARESIEQLQYESMQLAHELRKGGIKYSFDEEEEAKSLMNKIISQFIGKENE